MHAAEGVRRFIASYAPGSARKGLAGASTADDRAMFADFSDAIGCQREQLVGIGSSSFRVT
jgi:hypothetical protein